MTSQEPDYYAVLGAGRGASPADVDRAYRRAARATHPDLHPNDGSANERFRAVTIAYETLSDPERRASYDHGDSPASPGATVRIVVHQRPSAAPVHLGRQPPLSRPLQPVHTRPTVPLTEDVLEFVETFARMVSGWPYR